MASLGIQGTPSLPAPLSSQAWGLVVKAKAQVRVLKISITYYLKNIIATAKDPPKLNTYQRPKARCCRDQEDKVQEGEEICLIYTS